MSPPVGGLSALTQSGVMLTRPRLRMWPVILLSSPQLRPPCHENLTDSDLAPPENGVNCVRDTSVTLKGQSYMSQPF